MATISSSCVLDYGKKTVAFPQEDALVIGHWIETSSGK